MSAFSGGLFALVKVLIARRSQQRNVALLLCPKLDSMHIVMILIARLSLRSSRCWISIMI
jgi:hypothetical protein